MTSLYYTEQNYENAWLQKLQAGRFRLPMQSLQTRSLPSMVGALTLPPDGPYATSLDLGITDNAQQAPAEMAVKPIHLALAAVVLYLFLMP